MTIRLAVRLDIKHLRKVIEPLGIGATDVKLGSTLMTPALCGTGWNHGASSEGDSRDFNSRADAFEGKLVPQDPNDEPASTLLDRIRVRRRMKSVVNPGQRRKAHRLDLAVE